jgi:hypothetical protein
VKSTFFGVLYKETQKFQNVKYACVFFVLFVDSFRVVQNGKKLQNTKLVQEKDSK